MIRVHTLGTSLIQVCAQRITPASAKRFAFLLYLAAEPGRHHPRSVLHSLFFSDLSQKQAKHGIRELVYRLRQAGVVLETDMHGIQLSPTEVWRDWDDPLGDKPVDDETIRLIQGGFLPGYDPEISEEHTEWFGGFRGAAVSDLAKAMLREIDRAKLVANWRRAERAARACRAVDPLNSKATQALAEMLVIAGSEAKAAELIASYRADMNGDGRALSVSLKEVRHRIAEVSHHVDVRHPAARFAGREGEMTLLTNAFKDVKRGAANVVVLSGEPGIGKSRLLSEFAVYVALEAGAPLATTAHPHDTGMPLTVIRNLSKTLLDQHGAPGCSPQSLAWVRRLIKPDGDGPFASAEATSAAISSAVIELINAVSAETPLVLLIDDAQWADRASLELLQSIAVSPATKHVLIVLGAREARRIFELGYWGTRIAVAELSPLDQANAIALVIEQLGEGDGEHLALIEWMAELAGGNPFFLETIVGHYRATNERFSVPLAVNAVVDQRIRALTSEARDVLEAVVVLGRHATIARLEQVMDAPGAVLIRATRELEQRRLIVVSGRVMPSHWLITESVEHHASPIAGRMLHRRVATILEGEIGPTGDSSAFLDCAEMWVVAGEPGRAAELIATCAQRCLEIGRAREAAALYIRAAGLAGVSRREQFATIAIRVAASVVESALTIQGAALLTVDAQRDHDETELAILSARLRLGHDLDRTIDALTKCIVEESASNSHRLGAARFCLIFYDQNRQIEPVVAIEPLLLRLLTRKAEDETKRLQCAIIYHATFGDAAQVPPICEQLLATAAHARVDVAGELMQLAASGLFRSGRLSESIDIVSQCYSLAVDNGLTRMMDNAAMTLADWHLYAGSVDVAWQWFSAVSAIPRGTHDDYWEFARLTVEAEFALWQRDAATLFQVAEMAHRYVSGRQTVGPDRLYQSTRLAAMHISGSDIDADDAVERLTKHHVVGYELGESGDFEMTVATSIARAKRGDSAARELLLNYLEHVRRPGGRPSPALVNQSSLLSIDARSILDRRRRVVMERAPSL